MQAASYEWQMQLKSHFTVGTTILDILLFVNNQVIFAKSEYELQMVILQLLI
jgi:hypothetical protein